jgi:hypothetical protein
MLLPIDNAIRRRIDMMKKLTILAAMVLVMLALASPAMADSDRHNNRVDDDDRSHGNVIHVDDDFDWGSSRGWNWGDYEDCWEWSSVFEKWQWDCD